MDQVHLPDLRSQLNGVPYDKKWDILRPVLKDLFYRMTVPQIAQLIKERYGFDANIPAYKYRFKAWNCKKSVPTEVKDKILNPHYPRTVLGKRTAPTFHGNPIDVARLKRHVTSLVRQEPISLTRTIYASEQQAGIFGPYLPFGARVFLNWNRILQLSQLRALDFNFVISPRLPDTGFVDVDTSPASSPSPSQSSSPTSAPSPISSLVQTKTAIDRTDLFIQGQYINLVNQLNRSERRAMSKWLYEFWLYTYKKAKIWGTPIREDLCRSSNIQSTNSGSASMLGASYKSSPMPAAVLLATNRLSEYPENRRDPDSVCYWAIHALGPDEYYDNDPLSDVSSEATTEAIPLHEEPLDQSMLGALINNTFSKVDSKCLPLATPRLVQALQKSPETLLEESFAFAVMSRNVSLVKEMLNDNPMPRSRFASLYPLHIATSYLDGGKTCCVLLEVLLQGLTSYEWPELNDYGHTVVDNLMLTILKNHSDAPLSSADENLKHGATYTGIEVDVCGRWDVDSPCFETLRAAGQNRIPSGWKHKFCHTSVQAISHCLSHLGWRPSQRYSGLFLKRCTACGLKLQLSALHSLVMTGYTLTCAGQEDEDLFGIIAAYLCLIESGFYPASTAPVSLPHLLSHEVESDVCTHEKITSAELVQRLAPYIDGKNTDKVRIGWQLLLQVCRLAETACTAHADIDGGDNGDGDKRYSKFGITDHEDDGSEECSLCDDGVRGFDMGRNCAHIWASIQTEILTYRRADEYKPWLSDNFDMSGLLKSLQLDGTPAIGYIDKRLMRPYCHSCGRFGHWDMPLDCHTTSQDNSHLYSRRSTLISVNQQMMESIKDFGMEDLRGM